MNTITQALPTINLEDLNNQAEMMTRYDRKYLIPKKSLSPVIQQLPENTLFNNYQKIPKNWK